MKVVLSQVGHGQNYDISSQPMQQNAKIKSKFVTAG